MPRTGVLAQATRAEPEPGDREASDELKAHSRADVDLVLRTSDGTEIHLSQQLANLVMAAVDSLAVGRAVLAIPEEVSLTPAEVGELLGLSRPFVARLLDQGEIASEFLPDSSHRRVKMSDVLAFQTRRERRAEGRRRIADIAASADLPY